jgi:hypothetical protein
MWPLSLPADRDRVGGADVKSSRIYFIAPSETVRPRLKPEGSFSTALSLALSVTSLPFLSSANDGYHLSSSFSNS